MVSSRKRGRQEVEEAVEAPAPAPKEPGLLERIRNMWQFANLAQWIFLFGKAVKLEEDLDIEDLEMECLKHHSTKLAEIGLALLKFVSSHRGLTPEIFDEYTRRQYVAKAPERNPFGTEEEPAKFAEFDIFTKIKVLQQLTQWTFTNPDRIRERMEEQKDSEQTYWRVEPFGWDSEDRTYIVLDDNRLYRQTEPPPPPAPKATPKKNSKKARAAARASKRRRLSRVPASDSEEETEETEEVKEDKAVEDDGFGGIKWECLAITLDELNNAIASFAKSRDPNEKSLRQRLVDDLLPLLEKQEESRKRKQIQKERELLNLEKLATAKRSSRIAGKLEHQRQEEEAREEERKRQDELAMAKKEQEKWRKLEKERESRMQTREQRLKEREARRILHEEELANLSEDNKKLESGQGRLSERHLKAEIERKKAALDELQEEDGDWVFDCICGAYGHVDDGTLSIACEKCNVWQHTKCVGVSDADANRDDFQFVCKPCIRRAKEAEEAKKRPPITIKFNRPTSSASNAPPILPPVAANAPPTLPSFTANAPPTLPPVTALVPPQQKDETVRSPPSSPLKHRLVHSSPSRSPYDSPYSNGQPARQPIAYSNGSANLSTAPFPTFDNRPGSQGSVPAAPNWPQHMNGSSPARPVFGAQLNGQSPFSSPLPHSPNSFPPPVPQPNYALINGGHAPPVPAPAGVTSTPAPNGARYAPYDQSGRRSSLSFPSPLASAPVLNPPSTPGSSFSSAAGPPPPYALPISTPAQVRTPYASNAVLPPTSAGMSPTKQSPPRPMTANGAGSFSGSVGMGTPTCIPAIAPLSPSPMVQDLSPPVKASEPGRWAGGQGM
ncbi:hypothetical protein VF21_08443 [Pseudogymnoascus sp. 05NY08]|nr:hypothetical protein VF21_08443 [Pseudogymnoascus sp. 05NY08]